MDCLISSRIKLENNAQICNDFMLNDFSPKVCKQLNEDIKEINLHSNCENEQNKSIAITHISDLTAIKDLLELEINNPNEISKNFKFVCRESNLLPIAASCIASSEALIDNNPLFINIVPYNNKTYFIIGYNKLAGDSWLEKYLEKWSLFSEEEIQFECSRLLLTRCLNWCMSTEFYNELSHVQKERLLYFHMQYFTANRHYVTMNEWEQEKYNIFAN